MTGSDGLVVRVEDVREGVVERAVPGGVLAEDERLEEPRYVGPVPFRGAHVGHRLDCLILGAQDGGQALGRGATPGIGVWQIGRRFSTRHIHENPSLRHPTRSGCTHWLGSDQPYPGPVVMRRGWRTFHRKTRLAIVGRALTTS